MSFLPQGRANAEPPAETEALAVSEGASEALGGGLADAEPPADIG